MKILLPYFHINGTSSYPDDYTLFIGMEIVEFQGNVYYLTDYKGNKNLQVRATYEEYSAWLDLQPPKTGVRVVSPAGFRRRFTSAERRVISRSPDFEVEDYWNDILLRQEVNLDDPSLKAALVYFLNPVEGDPILANMARVEALLVDGTEYEVYIHSTTS